jgi:hypothetical protein
MDEGLPALKGLMRRRSVQLGSLAAVVLSLFAACKKGPGDLCKHDTECPAEHLCYSNHCQPKSKVMDDAAKACREDTHCKERGTCTPRLIGYQPQFDEDRWKCWATTDEDCARSDACKEYGQCRAQNDSCVK